MIQLILHNKSSHAKTRAIGKFPIGQSTLKNLHSRHTMSFRTFFESSNKIYIMFQNLKHNRVKKKEILVFVFERQFANLLPAKHHRRSNSSNA